MRPILIAARDPEFRTILARPAAAVGLCAAPGAHHLDANDAIERSGCVRRAPSAKVGTSGR